jgi:hypothetical protein
MADSRDIASMLCFSQSNPDGIGQGNVAALLRRLATTIDSLGDIDIHDITFASSPTADEDDLHMTVYYSRDPQRRQLRIATDE